ncbi:MAG: CheR family methyltransferase [Candidatus Methylomirabilales bacterium]
MSEEEFLLFRELVKAKAGIALSEAKRSLVQSRLARRLRHLGLRSYREYYDYLMEQDPTGEERVQFINALTTNLTHFFREGHHFEYLREVWLPGIRARAAETGQRRIRIWSAGCSTGEEPYSIAITLLEGLETDAGWDIHILASDIDTEVLAKAAEGVYPSDRIEGMSEDLLRRYFQEEKEAEVDHVTVLPKVRDLVFFRRINLLEDPWPMRTRFDMVFCRNVAIYFDGPTLEQLLKRFETALLDQGLLILGHSESLLGKEARFRHLGKTIYQKNDGGEDR